MNNPFKKQQRPTYVINVQPVALKAGDILVVQCERRVSRDVFLRLKAQLADSIPGCKVIVLEAGLKVAAVVTADEIARWEGEGGG